MPWRDPAGRFSPFKLAVFILLFVPAIMVAQQFMEGALGPRSINEAVHQVGNWTLKLILISLAITPGRRILQWPRLMLVRRMIGVAAFAYAVAHLTLYAADEAFDLRKVATEIVLRSYLTIGFAALLILAALAATSTDGMIRRLGGRRWRRLHRSVYVAALLSVVHFFMQSRFNVDEPWIMAGLFAWLMGYRAASWSGFWGGRLAGWWWPVALSVLAALGTALGEATYYRIKIGVSPLVLLEANLDVTMGLRPALVVLAIGLTAALTGALRQGVAELGQLVAAPATSPAGPRSRRDRSRGMPPAPRSAG